MADGGRGERPEVRGGGEKTGELWWAVCGVRGGAVGATVGKRED